MIRNTIIIKPRLKAADIKIIRNALNNYPYSFTDEQVPLSERKRWQQLKIIFNEIYDTEIR